LSFVAQLNGQLAAIRARGAVRSDTARGHDAGDTGGGSSAAGTSASPAQTATPTVTGRVPGPGPGPGPEPSTGPRPGPGRTPGRAPGRDPGRAQVPGAGFFGGDSASRASRAADRTRNGTGDQVSKMSSFGISNTSRKGFTLAWAEALADQVREIKFFYEQFCYK